MLMKLYQWLEEMLFEDTRDQLLDQIDELNYQVSELERKIEDFDHYRETRRHGYRPMRVHVIDEDARWAE